MLKLSLDGEWVARGAGMRELAATVPGSIHTDLLSANKIPDPFYRDNEAGLKWIGESDWVYSRKFSLERDFLEQEKILLSCAGLDTLATIKLNGKKVAATDNMFRQYYFEVKKHLRFGENKIEIMFDSPVNATRAAEKKSKLPQWVQMKAEPSIYHLRKQQCNYGWDWGASLPTCGIWRSLELIAFRRARLAEVQILQQHKSGRVTLKVNLSTEKIGKPKLSVAVALSKDGKTVAEGEASLREGRAGVELVVAKPELWWPNGMGAQPLYDICVELLDEDGELLDVWEKRIGLRTLRLERKNDKWGQSFQFAANGVPFFAKGANWIPGDAVLARMTPERYDDLLESAAAAHMNVLRVWGGGIYESPHFYDRCDELGLCVWQDFMYACSTYPVLDKAFVANAVAEAEDNVKALRHHACLALWCGNNELEQGLVGKTWTARTMARKDYLRFFRDTLGGVVKRLDPERDFIAGSPHNPTGDPFDANNPESGDAHLWKVWHGLEPFEWYRTCAHRFNSEFGFQSLPEPATLKDVILPEDENLTSRMMEYRQRSGVGNACIMKYLLDWFRLPTGFENTAWLSQILQGLAIKYAVEHWRRSMPRGMGTVYWQLNDTWQAPSWSSLDYYGRWKALHFMAQRFFAPVLLSLVEDMEKYEIEFHLTNDHALPLKGTIEWELLDTSGKNLACGTLAAEAKPRASTLVGVHLGKRFSLAKEVEKAGAHNVIFRAAFKGGDEIIAENTAFFRRPKHLSLRDPKIKTKVKAGKDGAFDVTLAGRYPALWVWLSMDGTALKCSDSFFHLFAGDTRTVTVRPEKKMSLGEFSRALKATSLFDTWRE